jgi:hypothetical protein
MNPERFRSRRPGPMDLDYAPRNQPNLTLPSVPQTLTAAIGLSPFCTSGGYPVVQKSCSSCAM